MTRKHVQHATTSIFSRQACVERQREARPGCTAVATTTAINHVHTLRDCHDQQTPAACRRGHRRLAPPLHRLAIFSRRRLHRASVRPSVRIDFASASAAAATRPVVYTPQINHRLILFARVCITDSSTALIRPAVLVCPWRARPIAPAVDIMTQTGH